jgi:hypothetical protein
MGRVDGLAAGDGRVHDRASGLGLLRRKRLGARDAAGHDIGATDDRRPLVGLPAVGLRGGGVAGRLCQRPDRQRRAPAAGAGRRDRAARCVADKGVHRPRRGQPADRQVPPAGGDRPGPAEAGPGATVPRQCRSACPRGATLSGTRTGDHQPSRAKSILHRPRDVSGDAARAAPCGPRRRRAQGGGDLRARRRRQDRVGPRVRTPPCRRLRRRLVDPWRPHDVDRRRARRARAPPRRRRPGRPRRHGGRAVQQAPRTRPLAAGLRQRWTG